MPKRKKRSDLLVSFFFIGILSYLNVYLISIIWKCLRGYLGIFELAGLTYLYLSVQSGLNLSSDGISGPNISDLPAEGLDLSDVPPADESDGHGTPEEESDWVLSFLLF